MVVRTFFDELVDGDEVLAFTRVERGRGRRRTVLAVHPPGPRSGDEVVHEHLPLYIVESNRGMVS